MIKEVKQLSLVAAVSLITGHTALHADFGDAVVGGIVGGAVGSVITNEVYNANKQAPQPQQSAAPRSQEQYYAPASVPQLTDEKKIQRALSSMGFYRGRIDGQINSFETRAAIKEMNKAYEISNNASLKPEAKDTLIFLGTLFEMDRYLIAQGNDKRTRDKKIQAALKVHGYYPGKIDGAIGRGSRAAITQYKANNGLGYGASLDFEQEYQLVSSAKEKNDQNIEESIASLKGIGQPDQTPQQNKVINIQQPAQTNR